MKSLNSKLHRHSEVAIDSAPMVSVTPIEELMERLREDIGRVMAEAGYSMPPEAKSDVFKAALAMFRVMHRQLAARPRKVFWSKELRARALSSDLAAAVHLVENEVRDGADLNPRLTRRFFKSAFNDSLLNDLGVQHFHLGEPGKGRKGQVGSTSALLFAFVSEEAVYFLDVLDHEAFTRDDLLGILADNWPHILEAFTMPGIRGSDGSPLSPEKRAQARAAGLTVLESFRGKAFRPPGGGLATDGTSSVAVSRTMDFLKKIRIHHEWVVENADSFAKQIFETQRTVVRSWDLRVRCDFKEIYFECMATGVLLFPERGSAHIPMNQAEERQKA